MKILIFKQSQLNFSTLSMLMLIKHLLQNFCFMIYSGENNLRKVTDYVSGKDQKQYFW